MKKSMEQPQSTIYNLQELTSRSFAIPLMSKKLNSVQKYVSSYKTNPRSIQEQIRNDRVESMLSTNAQKLIFGGKLTPDPQASLLNQTKCYVKYLPLIQQRTEDRLQQLDKIQIQYEHLKNNLNSSKDPFTSKFTVPLSRRRHIRNSETSMAKLQVSQKQIDKSLKKQILIQDGQRQFADLYLMKKDRIRLKDQIQKNRKFDIKQHSIDDQYKQRENLLLQKRTKQLQEKKNKMLKNKGLHWNVYYEMLALSKDEKQRVRSSNSNFVSSFGLN